MAKENPSGPKPESSIGAEDVLCESRESLAALIDFFPDATLIIDKDKKVVVWNRAIEEMTGVSAAQMIGRGGYAYAVPFYGVARPKLMDLFWEPENRISDEYSPLQREGDSIVAETFAPALNGAKGAYLWVKCSAIRNHSGKLIGAIECIRDISRRHESEKKYRDLVERSSDGILVVQDGLVRFGNRALEELTGYEKETVIGRSIADFVTAGYKGMVMDRYARRLAGSTADSRYEFEIIRRDGQPLFVEINSSRIDFEGRPAVMAIIRDVSRAKKIDRAKSEFISIASHQLRSPLTGIKWFGQLLIDQKAGKLAGKQLEYVRQMYNSNERMIRLVNDLLDVSHIETGEKFMIDKKQNDIIALINYVIKDQTVGLPERRITLETEEGYPEKLIFAFDRDKIYQVLANLVNNAVKYSDPDTPVVVSLEHSGNMMELSVKDSGRGIPLYQQDKVFQKFFRADNIATVSTEGTGLGLYIAKNIVEAHGGRIWFESSQDKGTTFHFSLPLS